MRKTFSFIKLLFAFLLLAVVSKMIGAKPLSEQALDFSKLTGKAKGGIEHAHAEYYSTGDNGCAAGCGCNCTGCGHACCETGCACGCAAGCTGGDKGDGGAGGDGKGGDKGDGACK